MTSVRALDAQFLYQRCDPAVLPFESTAELSERTEIVGQARAVEAVRFGLDIQQPGYNLFVLGEPGSGRHSVVRRLLEVKSAEGPVPADECYVHNFAEENRPRLLRVPAGRGGQLRRDMQRFVAELTRAISAAFESDEYRTRIDALQSAYKQKEELALRELGEEASAQGVVLLRTPHGFGFAPLKGDAPMDPEEFAKLPDAERERIGKQIASSSEKLKRTMLEFPRWRRELQAKLKEVGRETLGVAVGHLIEELRESYRELAEVQTFLEQVLTDVIEVGEQLHEQPKSEGDALNVVFSTTLSLLRYQVNLLVDHAQQRGSPMVWEDNPTYSNLVGRIDHVAQLGTLVTNFTLIKPGALQRANGGYLVLDALKVLMQPYAWEGLKRALRSRQVRIESLHQALGLVGAMSLEPEPLPLSVKVVLIGERQIYYLLKTLDPEFAELFNVAADFENELPRDPDSSRLYAQFIATLARSSGLRHLERGAVARVIEHSARLSGSSDRLTVSRRRIALLLQEADHWAGRAGRATVASADVETALEAQLRRSDRLQTKLQQEILRENLLIAVSGSRAGQVNGLAVIELDDCTFGHPVRITATVRVGEGNVVDIERESELGGPLHSKGVLILTSFLGARFARQVPLSFSASLVFEQSYGPVEGDSASLAELCALLSDLAHLPVRQSLAVTGSVSQFGQVQAIGAVNEKIEGFFDICRARGLSGEQGVLIPASNVKHLMLRRDVVRACEEGLFGIYPVEHVDQAIELLTGVPVGVPDERGRVPKGSVNSLVVAQLAELSELRRSFASGMGPRPRRKRASSRHK